MAPTPRTDKHPSELGVDVDAPTPTPTPEQPGSAPPAAAAGWQRVACYNLATGAFVGYLTSSGNFTCLAPDAAGAVNLAWCPSGGELYLQADQTPFSRYLGTSFTGERWACWKRWSAGAGVVAVVYNPDHTLSQEEDPTLKLAGAAPAQGGLAWVYWSDAPDDPNCLRLEVA
jgi:hypothetical protein